MRLEQNCEKFATVMIFLQLNSSQARIVGGSYAQPNEYVSMAGIIDITQNDAPEGPIFCGASLSEKTLLIIHTFSLHT